MINAQNRPDMSWQVGDRIQFIMDEFSEFNDGIKQDAWKGDTGTIIEISHQHFCEDFDWAILFVVAIDQSCLNDDRDRWCELAITDRHNSINLDRLHWIMNPEYTGKPIEIDWEALAIKLDCTLAELNQYWNNGGIFVFDSLDSICDFYRGSGLDQPAADALKEDLKNQSVIYTQHLFFMWA